MSTNQNEDGYASNVPIAFALVAGAGLATTFGAMMVFCHCVVSRSKQRVLGASLGFSSGVMIYVSFIEIQSKAVAAFQSCECLWDTQSNEDAAYTAATLCFFLGVAIVFVLDLVVHWFSARGFGFGKHSHSHGDHHDHQHPQHHSRTGSITDSNVNQNTQFGPHTQEEEKARKKDANAIVDPAMAVTTTPEEEEETPADADEEEDGVARLQQRLSHVLPPANTTTAAAEADSFDVESQTRTQTMEDKKRLIHMGLMTAMAIGLHNFPEGLATFVAALADPKVGAGLAVAIAIHNIPEGLCVAIPIYYATGSRCKAFAIAFLSGITELIGAALGYAFLMAAMGPAAYAVLFGLVSGMMVTIALKELLPTAHAYDPKDTLVTKMLVFGMMIMAISLMLFKI